MTAMQRIIHVMRGIALAAALAGCTSEPSRIEDGPNTAAPFGYYDYCDRLKDADPICSWVKR